MIDKINKLPRVVIIASVIVIGAIVARGYPYVGKGIILLSMLSYILFNIKHTIKTIKYRKNKSREELFIASLPIIMFILCLTTIRAEHISYLFILMVLACDYLIKEDNAK